MLRIWWDISCRLVNVFIFRLYSQSVFVGGGLDRTAYIALAISFFTIITTIHCQDFRDIEGDRLSGRKTLPIQFGQSASRALFSFFVIFWSLVIPHFWNLPLLYRAVYLLAGLYLGVCVFRRRAVNDDKRSYRLYNVSPAPSTRTLELLNSF